MDSHQPCYSLALDSVSMRTFFRHFPGTPLSPSLFPYSFLPFWSQYSVCMPFASHFDSRFHRPVKLTVAAPSFGARRKKKILPIGHDCSPKFPIVREGPPGPICRGQPRVALLFYFFPLLPLSLSLARFVNAAFVSFSPLPFLSGLSK